MVRFFHMEEPQFNAYLLSTYKNMMDFNRNRRGDGGRKFEKKNFGKRNFGSGTPHQGAMHQTTCAECGNSCEVPFKPSGDRPVFCNNCFRKDSNKSYHKNEDAGYLKEQLKILDIKLDRILKILTSPPHEPAHTAMIQETKTAAPEKTEKKRRKKA